METTTRSTPTWTSYDKSTSERYQQKPHTSRTCDPHSPNVGPVRIQLCDVAWHERSVLSATTVHRLGDREARQYSSTEILDDVELDAGVTSAGFGQLRPTSDDLRWVSVVPEPEGTGSSAWRHQ